MDGNGKERVQRNFISVSLQVTKNCVVGLMCWQGEKFAPVTLHPPQIPHCLAWIQTQAFTVTGQRLPRGPQAHHQNT